MEIPELLRLTDDTSNDFSITDLREVSGSAVEVQQRRAEPVQFIRSAMPRLEPSARAQARRYEPFVDDLLQSLCILRT